MLRQPELCPGPPSAERTPQEPSIWPAACGSPAERAWNTLWKLLAKLCSGTAGPPQPFGEIVVSVLGGPSQVSHVERMYPGGRRNVPLVGFSGVRRPFGAGAKSTSWWLHSPARTTAWRFWGLHTGTGCLPVVRVILASSPVLEESCLCLPGAFWEIPGSAGSLGEGRYLGDICWGN